jgi:hypothetical protein
MTTHIQRAQTMITAVVATALLGLAADSALAQVDPATDPAIDHNVRAFLKVLNSGGGKPLEQLPPKEARAVLVNAQASVKLVLPRATCRRRPLRQMV